MTVAKDRSFRQKSRFLVEVMQSRGKWYSCHQPLHAQHLLHYAHLYRFIVVVVDTASDEEQSEVYEIADPTTRFKSDTWKPLGFPVSRNEK